MSNFIFLTLILKVDFLAQIPLIGFYDKLKIRTVLFDLDIG